MKKPTFALLLAVAVPTSVMAEPPGGTVTFDNWVVGCDNAQFCRMVGIKGEISEWNEGATLSLARKGGKDGALAQLEFDSSMVEGDAGLANGLDIDGQRFWPEEITDADKSEESEEVIKRRYIPVTIEMMRAMASGKSLKVIDLAGKPLGEYPLTGLNYALRYVDALQSRDGTVTAVMAPGENSEDYVYSGEGYSTYYVPPRAAGKAPFTLSDAEAKAWQAKLGCWEDGDDPAREGPRDMQLSRLDDGHALAYISCTSGAYNFSSFALVIDKNGAHPARYDIGPGIWSEISVELVTNGGFEESSGILSGYAKGRGLGDCGTNYSWIWDPKGELFRLTDWNEMPECRGPNDWITRWKANVVYGEAPPTE